MKRNIKVPKKLYEEKSKIENNQTTTKSCSKKDESVLVIIKQVINAYLLAGFGMVLAGHILNHVKDWRSFTQVPVLLLMTPALLGLKGNLEMTYISRFSTQVNTGILKNKDTTIRYIKANLVLTQLQSILVSFLASVVASLFGKGGISSFFQTEKLLLVAFSAIITTSIASFVLGLLMTLVVIISHHYNINPDHIATPLAGGLGDLVTVSLMAVVSSLALDFIHSHRTIMITTLILILILLPFFYHICLREDCTSDVLVHGWRPMIAAMVISSTGGYILDRFINDFPGIVLLQPLVNGTGGNLVSIQASRHSTFLHQVVEKDNRSKDGSPYNEACTRSKLALKLIVLPCHVIFMSLIHLIHSGGEFWCVSFVPFYLSAVFLQVSILLSLSDIIVMRLWKSNKDPDTCSIPYLTSLGDVMGISFLTIAFALHRQFLVWWG